MLAPPRAAVVDAIATDSLSRYQLPAMTIAIVERGRIVYAKAYNGSTKGAQVRVDTRFEIGSVTKEILAAETMQLASQHRLALTDRVSRFLAGAPTTLTIADLLNQRSGLRDYNTPLVATKLLPLIVTGRLVPSQIAHVVLSEPPAFVPGTQFQYSNSNYVVLGLALERITHRPIATTLAHDVFQPLGMTDTALSDEAACTPEAACGFTKTPWGVQTVRPWGTNITYTAGGLYSTALDLARFDVALMTNDRFKDWRQAQLSRPHDGSYAWGAFAYSSGEQTILWHDGTVLGFKAMNSLVLPNDDAVVILTNADYAHAQIIAMKLEHALFGIPGGENEPIDLNLPRFSYAIALCALAVTLLLAFVWRIHHPLVFVLALCFYISGTFTWIAPLIGAAVTIALIVMLRPRTA